MSNQDAQAAGERVEALLTALRSHAGPDAAAAAEELVSCLVQLYGDGLARIVAILGADEEGAGPRLLATMVADPLVESLLLVHDLHPLDTGTRVRRAVEEVLPQLGSHAGDVEYLGLDAQGVLRLRLEQRGCSADTVRDLISKAVAAAAPEAAGIGIELVRPPAEPPLLQITRRPAGVLRAGKDRAGGAAADPGAGPERCEMCHEVLDDRHGHLVDIDKRSLACACRACYLLFTHEGAAGGRYRAVPERVLADPSRPLAEADWSELQIPVTMAFFFFNSALARVVAGYPSPGGVTECELDLAAWDRLAAAYPLLAEMAPDTEAIFVRQDEIFLVPIDMCYSLVGQLRRYWQGFDGGAEARAAVDAFLADLRRRAVVPERGP